MIIETKKEILSVLKSDDKEFYGDIVPEARKLTERTKGNKLIVNAMMGYTNICKNMCLYCGMRASNKIERYRIPPEDVIDVCRKANASGYGRLFLVAGEDPKYGFDNLLKIVSALHREGMYISLACGEMEASEYGELKSAGADEYVLKFEMSNPESFNRLNPSTTFEKRMKAIETVKALGFRLASGNIIDWPGQTVEELADDIYLMKELDISWAPIIPFLPAAGTPLAEGMRRGSLGLLYREIAILRIMMPEVNITAQQPGEDMRRGLSDPDGNLAAVKAGANMLFFDLLPEYRTKNFRVVDDRNITGPAHIFEIAKRGDYMLETTVRK